MQGRTILLVVLAGWLGVIALTALGAHFSPRSRPAGSGTAEAVGRRSPGADRLTPKEPRPSPRERFLDRQRKLPRVAGCQRIDIGDPAAEANRNARAGDLRPFTQYGFIPQRPPPGIFCPRGDYGAIVSRGGTFISDMPDACGSMSFSIADPKKMEAYNRALAARADFKRLTGCRPATLCEARYGAGGQGSLVKLDPDCPTEPTVFVEIAAYRPAGDLAKAVRQYRASHGLSRDLMTQGALAAASNANWANLKVLVTAGADPNGRTTRTDARRPWLTPSPLSAVFNQNTDRANQIAAARWLLAHGASVKVGGGNALVSAAFSGDSAAVDFLLRTGAPANGERSSDEIERLARSNPEVSNPDGFYFTRSPLYAALENGLLRRSDASPKDERWARQEEAKAQWIALRLYTAGARFVSGVGDDRLIDNPNQHLASIMIAAADREGRRREYLARLQADLLARGSLAGKQERLLAYVRRIGACRAPVNIARTDHVQLCRYGGI